LIYVVLMTNLAFFDFFLPFWPILVFVFLAFLAFFGKIWTSCSLHRGYI
jgi:hypothetical protein